MPKIPQYTTQTEAAGPIQMRQATNQDSGGVGSAIEAAGQALSNTGQILERREGQAEVSKLNAMLSKMHADSTNSLNETLSTADLSDKNVAENFMQKFDDNLNKIGESIETRAGRNYFERASASLRSHFSQAATQGQAINIGAGAKNDYVQSINNLSSGLINDPSSFETAKDVHKVGLESLVQTGGIPANQAAQLQTKGEQELAKSAIRGWMKLDPELAKEQLNSGKWDSYFDGDVKHQMMSETTQAIHGLQVEQMRLAAERQRILAEQQTATQNNFLQKMYDNQLTAHDILNSKLEPFGSGSKEQMLNLLAKSQNEKIKDDPNLVQELFARVHLPDGDPKKILNENEFNQYFGNGLGKEGLNMLRAEVSGRKTSDGRTESDWKKKVLDDAEHTLVRGNKMLGITDPLGEEQMMRFSMWFNKAYSEGRKAGKSPEQLLSPDSPDSLVPAIRRYVRSPEQIMKDNIKMFKTPEPGLAAPAAVSPASYGPPAPANYTPSAAAAAGYSPTVAAPQAPAAPVPAAPVLSPRKSGESPQEYLKRIGK